MNVLDSIKEVRRWRSRAEGSVGLVPTMGYLHEGHLSLLRRARTENARTLATIFVNPAQFGPNEDFTRYPRTPDADTAGLEGAGCDVLWLPTVESMYPFGVELASRVHVPGVSGVLEGAVLASSEAGDWPDANGLAGYVASLSEDESRALAETLRRGQGGES